MRVIEASRFDIARIRSSRAPVVLLSVLTALSLTGGFAFGFLAKSVLSDQTGGSLAEGIRFVATKGSFGLAVAVVSGVLLVGKDYRRETVTMSLLLFRRSDYLLSKALLCSAAGIVTSLTGMGASLVSGCVVGGSCFAGAQPLGLAALVIQVGFSGCAAGLIGGALAGVSQSLVLPIISSIGYLALVEPALQGFLNISDGTLSRTASMLLPYRALTTLSRGVDPGSLLFGHEATKSTVLVALLVVAVVTVLLCALAWRSVSKLDVR